MIYFLYIFIFGLCSPYDRKRTMHLRFQLPWPCSIIILKFNHNNLRKEQIFKICKTYHKLWNGISLLQFNEVDLSKITSSTYLTLIESSILSSQLFVTQVFACIGRITIPRSSRFVITNVINLPHSLFYFTCSVKMVVWLFNISSHHFMRTHFTFLPTVSDLLNL